MNDDFLPAPSEDLRLDAAPQPGGSPGRQSRKWAAATAILCGTLATCLAAWVYWERTAPRSLDQLEPRDIPEKYRFAGQPPELVAVLRTPKGHLGCVCVAFSPDGKRLAAGFGSGTVAVWEAGRLDAAFVLESHPMRPVSSVVFTPDGKTLVDASFDHTIRLWDLAGRNPVPRATLHGHKDDVESLALSRDGKLLASAGGGDRTVRLWDLSSDPPRETTLIQIPWNLVFSVSLSPDGRTLACTCKDTVHLWDVTGDKPRERGALRGHEDSVWRTDFAPDGQTVASCGRDRIVRLWDVGGKQPRERAVLRGHDSIHLYGLAFSSDGKLLASADMGGRVIVWNAGDGGKLREWNLPVEPRGIAFALDSRHLAVSTNQTAVYILRLP